jgi:hypothetical protein
MAVAVDVAVAVAVAVARRRILQLGLASSFSLLVTNSPG